MISAAQPCSAAGKPASEHIGSPLPASLCGQLNSMTMPPCSRLCTHHSRGTISWWKPHTAVQGQCGPDDGGSLKYFTTSQKLTCTAPSSTGGETSRLQP